MSKNENNSNKVRVLVNPRTKEYKDIPASDVLVNGIPLGTILNRVSTLETNFNKLIDVLKNKEVR